MSTGPASPQHGTPGGPATLSGPLFPLLEKGNSMASYVCLMSDVTRSRPAGPAGEGCAKAGWTAEGRGGRTVMECEFIKS